MPQENILTTMLARLASVPFRLARRPFVPPQKALICHPCCLSQVMLATPLLTALAHAFPQARFDWAVSDWARPAIVGNPHITELVRTGPGSLAHMSWEEVRQLIQTLREEAYDTCFIPGRSSILAFIAWRAGIPQRVGLNVGGRGFAHTLPVRPPAGEQHAATQYLAIAKAIGADFSYEARLPMSFYPADSDRTAVTRRLIDDLDWLGDRPLAVMHPGGGYGSAQADTRKRWPAERFVRLGNHLTRQHEASLLLVGGESDREQAEAIAGMMVAPVANWVGRVSLGELGALGEIADLYIGNDTGPTHIAAAVGCTTLAIFGPSRPAVSAPYAVSDSQRVITLWRELTARPFSWEDGVTVAEAIKAVDKLLKPQR